MRTAHLGSLIPVESEPTQGLEDERLGAGDITLLIGVLDAEDEVAARMARREPREEGGANRAEVQRAGGGRREPGANPRVGH